jgi:hypothetical protein
MLILKRNVMILFLNMKIIHILVIAVLALLVVGAPVLAIFTSQASSPQVHFQSSIVGSTPDTPIDGINSGGAPWVVAAGEAGLTPSGMLQLNVVGLLISQGPLNGTTGPVSSVFASLVCQGTGNVVASTSSVPLASNGNAQINQQVTLPTSCAGLIILIETTVNSKTFYIASTGFVS